MGGHCSGALFGPTLGNASEPFPEEIIREAETKMARARIVSNPVVDAVRTGSASKLDKDHAFPRIVDNYVGYAHRFNVVGGDGVSRLLFQLRGSLNGVQGVFEWIVDPDPARGVTHRRFIGGGSITGKPNQVVRRTRE